MWHYRLSSLIWCYKKFSKCDTHTLIVVKPCVFNSISSIENDTIWVLDYWKWIHIVTLYEFAFQYWSLYGFSIISYLLKKYSVVLLNILLKMKLYCCSIHYKQSNKFKKKYVRLFVLYTVLCLCPVSKSYVD